MNIRKIAASIIAVTGIITAPSAMAANNGNIVTLGDSFSANPDQIVNTIKGPLAAGYPQNEGCLQSGDNWPRRLGAKTGRSVADWSCTAQTSGSMLGRLDRAIAHNDVRNDSTVIMAIGMNDFGPFGFTDNGTFGLLNPAQTSSKYKSNIRSAVNKIRSVAPGAHIVLSGVLPTVDRNTMSFCAVNVIPNMPLGAPIPLIRDVENWNRDNQRAAAAENGVSYVEMIDTSDGHSTCANDDQRYVAGIIDTTSDYHMMFHPTAQGSEHMASVLAANV